MTTSVSVCPYPGGKARLASEILPLLQTRHRQYREPFAGGGGIGLRILSSGHRDVWVNDLDIAICVTWQTLAWYPGELKRAVRDLVPTAEAINREKSRLLSNPRYPTSPAAFAAMAAIKIAAHKLAYSAIPRLSWVADIKRKWRPAQVCRHIDALSPMLRGCRITNLDFSSLLLDSSRKAMIYLDPPYYQMGNGLYRHGLQICDHVRLRDMLKESHHSWVLSYDDCDVIRDLYGFANIRIVETFYSTSSKIGRELIITPHERVFVSMAMAA